MPKLKLQNFGHLMQRTDSLDETLMLGKIEGKRRRWWPEDELIRQHLWLNGHEFEQTLGDSVIQRSLVCCSPGVTKNQRQWLINSTLSSVIWSMCKCVCVCVVSSVQLFATPWTLVYQTPMSMDFFRLYYWCGLTFPTPGDHPEPEIKPPSLASPILAGGFVTTIPSGKPFS